MVGGTGKRTPKQQEAYDKYKRDIAIWDAKEKKKAVDKYNKENPSKSSGSFLNWSKAVVQLLAGDEEALTAALSGDKERLLIDGESMSTAEFIGSIFFLVAFAAAGSGGKKLGARGSKPSKLRISPKDIYEDPNFKYKNPPKDIIQAQLDSFNKLTYDQQINTLAKSSKLEGNRLEAKFKNNPTPENQSVMDRAGLTYSEYQRQINTLAEHNRLNVAEGEKIRRQDTILKLQNAKNDSRTPIDFIKEFRSKKGRPPTLEELYQYTIQELNKKKLNPPKPPEVPYESEVIGEVEPVEDGLLEVPPEVKPEPPVGEEVIDPPSEAKTEVVDIDEKGTPDGTESKETNQEVVNSWYDTYGGVENESVSEELQLLSRRVMDGLDPEGDPILDNPNMYGEYIEEFDITPDERTQLLEAYDNPKVFNILRANYKKALAVMVGGTITGGFLGGGGTGAGAGALPPDDDFPPVEPDDGDMDLVEDIDDDIGGTITGGGITTTGESGSTGDIGKTTSTNHIHKFKQAVNVENIDLLISEAARLSKEAYNVTEIGTDDFYFIDQFTVPVLFNKQGNKLYVAFRGTDSLENKLTDLSLQSLDGDSTMNLIKSYGNLNQRLDDYYSNVKMHAGFLEKMNELYTLVRYEIDKYYDSVTDLILCGHSYGSAMCSIFYYLYMNDIYLEYKLDEVRAVGFGGPRFLFNEYEKIYNDNCPNLIRCFNKNDIVTYIPFNKSISFIPSIIEGYIHVGRPLCLDGSTYNSSANQLIIQILQGNKEKIAILLKRRSTLEGSRLIQFILSPEYQKLVLKSTVQCFQKLRIKKEITKQDITFLTKQFYTNSEKLADYTAKCQLLKPYSLSDILESSPIAGEDKDQQDFTVASIGGMALGFNQLSVSAHSMDTYIHNIKLLIHYELKYNQDILEIKTDGQEETVDDEEELSSEAYMTSGKEKTLNDEVKNAPVINNESTTNTNVPIPETSKTNISPDSFNVEDIVSKILNKEYKGIIGFTTEDFEEGTIVEID
ncbi:MAG: hypothetical protein ACI9YE_000467 [Psychroserpens sp.]|jgi:hypothetical protein